MHNTSTLCCVCVLLLFQYRKKVLSCNSNQALKLTVVLLNYFNKMYRNVQQSGKTYLTFKWSYRRSFSLLKNKMYVFFSGQITFTYKHNLQSDSLALHARRHTSCKCWIYVLWHLSTCYMSMVWYEESYLLKPKPRRMSGYVKLLQSLSKRLSSSRKYLAKEHYTNNYTATN